jgi:tetratricopeptide (TPR) repeat protein
VVPQVIQQKKQPKKVRKKERVLNSSSDNEITTPIEAVKAKKANVEELQKLFAKRHSYNLAIKIAREFFSKREYNEALEWAKKANKLNRNEEEAWILYAKSLYALGKKEQAKRILRLYLEYANSSEAQKLLREWR